MAPLEFVPLMSAKPVGELPEGDEWEYEAKLDGYRGLLLCEGRAVQIRSRNDKDLTRSYPSIVRAAAKMPVRRASIDGEIVALDKVGRPSFQELQHPSRAHLIVFFAFDVLHLDDRDLRTRPLQERRKKLPRIVGDSGIRVSIELPGTAANVIASVTKLGLEGVVAKLRTSPYDANLTDAWVKYRLDRQQEVVIGGYKGGASSFDTIVVGYYDGQALRFAGKVNAGYTPYLRRMLFAQLRPLIIKQCPFSDLPNSKSTHWAGGITSQEMSTVTWVRPSIVVQVGFRQWTDEGRLRLPKFLGLRPDKAAKQVHREP
jgi:bifunctional non-homologous end joining protein LigD